jgi:predicted permease
MYFSPLAEFDVFASKALGLDSIILPLIIFVVSATIGSLAFYLTKNTFTPSVRALFGYACGLGNTLNFGLPVCLAIIPGNSDEIISTVMLYTLGLVVYNHTFSAYSKHKKSFPFDRLEECAVNPSLKNNLTLHLKVFFLVKPSARVCDFLLCLLFIVLLLPVVLYSNPKKSCPKISGKNAKK